MKRRMVPIYNLPVHFTNDEADCREFLKRHGGDEHATDGCKGVMIRFSGDCDEGYLVMAVYDGDVGTVAHEAVHTAWRYLESCGVKVNINNQEPLAFLTGWLFKTFLDLFPEKEAAA